MAVTMDRRTVPRTVGALVGAVLVTGTLLLPSNGAEVDFSHCVEIKVNSSTEKGDLVQKLAEQYNADRRVVGGVCGRVEVEKLTSGAASEHLERGWNEQASEVSEPDVWLPSTSLWARLLEHRRGEDVVSGEDDSIITSPLVIAMPERMAKALGWPERSLGWSDLRDLVNGPGWSEYGHPEWGRFRMGKDNPRLSSSGLAATIATYHAATLAHGGFTERNLDENGDVLTFARNIESSVLHYEKDSVVFLETLYAEEQKASPRPYVSAIAIQEQMVYHYNQGELAGEVTDLGTKAKPRDRLVAIHPDDGTVLLDHPYLVLRGVSEQKRAVAEDFRTYLLAEKQQQAFVEDGFRDAEGETDEIVASSVGSSTRWDTKPIDLPETAMVHTMLESWEKVRLRGSVLLLLDVSESMKETADAAATQVESKLEKLRPAVLRGLELLDDDDEVALWTFATEPAFTEVVPMGRVDKVRDELTAHVKGLTVRGNRTALYEATHAAHEAMREDLDADRINAVVVLTDGHDTTRDGMSRAELLDAIDAEYLDTSVRVFTIAYGKDADRATLAEIAAASKAQSYDASDPNTIEQVFISAFSNF